MKILAQLFISLVGLHLTVFAGAPEQGKLRWEDQESGQVIFSVEDIVRFDWDRQVFELKRDRAMDLMIFIVPHKYPSRPFIVRDADGVIYAGRFVNPSSSKSWNEPVILSDRVQNKTPFLTIENGYHGHQGGDQRFNPRLAQALRQAGVLKSIPADEQPARIERTSSEWFGEKGNLRMRAELFPETFRIGQNARIHLFFAFGRSRPPAFDLVELHSTLRAKNGFSCTVDHSLPDKLTPKTLDDGVFIVRSKFWGPNRSALPSTAEPGPATISFQLNLRKQAAAVNAVVYSVQIPPQEVTVFPPKMEP